jgi:hypothetical protein
MAKTGPHRGGRPAVLCPHGVLGVQRCLPCVNKRRNKLVLTAEQKRNARKRSQQWKHKPKNANHCRAYSRKRMGIPILEGKSVQGECILCLRTLTLVPDHDHVTGALRGWICGVCNRMMGVYETLKKDGRLKRMQKYLKETTNGTI